jgi:predicted RNA-binding protein with TRAM domain
MRIIQYKLRRGGEILYKKDFGSSSNGGYNSFDRMAPREAPVEIGKQYDVKIEEIARQGDGIARIEGFVVFVPSTQIDDELKIEIKAIKRTCAIGEAV